MADYVSIQNENLEPGAPWISATAFALRDNPVAIAEGAAGAPRIQAGGIGTGAVTNAKVSNGALGAEKFQTGATERNWVLARTAAAAVGAVGTYAMLRTDAVEDQASVAAGSTRAGSGLRYASARGDVSVTPPGTWRLMGFLASTGTSDSGDARTSVWLRIS